MQVLRTRVPGPRRFVRNRFPLVLRSESWRPEDQRNHSKKLPGRPRRIISLVLIFTGSSLCAYVAGTYSWMYARQKLLLREWNSQNPAVRESFAKLSIPKIGMEDVVLEGVSRHSLLLGPAHLKSSAEPGTTGNVVIAGHRDSFFRRIHSLRYGDDVFVIRGEQKVHYVVRERRIVKPSDLSVLKPTKDAELTLITCYPTHAIGPAPERLIVVAKQAR